MSETETVEDNPTPSRSADELLADLRQTQQDLAREREALRAEREAVAGLRDAVVSAVRPPAPPPPTSSGVELPSDDDFDSDRLGSTARVAAEVTRRALSSYHEGVQSEIAELRRAQLDTEWERVKAEDPKNFARLERGMRSFLEKADYQPGLVRNLFYRMRGEHMSKLLEMDAAERAKEPVAQPNSAAAPRKTKEDFDTLTADEVKYCKGLGVPPESYFGLKHQKTPKFEKGYLTSLGFQEGATK